MNGTLTIGTHVRLKDAYLDDELTKPVTGMVRGMFRRPDWGNEDALCVMFDHDDPMLPPGGEFSAGRLAAQLSSGPQEEQVSPSSEYDPLEGVL